MMSLSSVVSSILPRRAKEWIKTRAEIRYWRRCQSVEATLANSHYEYFYTALFGLEREDYAGKAVLDVGCGPRGSLEWATGAKDRVGLDPLADSYRALGTDSHAMRYVCAPAEAMPLEDGSFDIVTSFNSLDHVEDPVRAARELVRVLAPGGTLLLIVEVEHEATLTEPHRLHSDTTTRLFPDMELAWEARYRMDDTRGMYEQIRRDDRVDGDMLDEAHILVARLHKPAAAA